VNDIWQELKTKLEAQLVVYKSLQQLLLDEQEAIGNLDTTRMDQLNKGKEDLVVQQRQSTEILRSLLAKLTKQLALPAGSNLGAIVTSAPKEAQPALQYLKTEISRISTELKNLADQNRAVLERFLGTVNESLGFLTRTLNSSNMYGSSGTYRTERTGAMIVNREA
jgi:flagellar biosynthesis/type III secretory pathway chaperone